ncbi:PilN domain-containing protein [Marinicella meishanensis]|uniref:PilN domain-containing protein n=1 Tax=Marinicella meishanensis TaxID=2873263 RepID=UPI001CBB52FF|nr:PilN domain-containing protein [Marinicella sp. NBU2979]
MTTYIEKITEPLSQWYQQSSIHAFMVWWTTEMKAMVPSQYQAKLFPRSLSVFVTDAEAGDDAVQLWQQEGHEMSTLTCDDTVADKEWWHQLNHYLGTAEQTTEVTCLLPEAKVLIREVALPVAVYNEVESVLQFELDKYIPFKADEVVFSCDKGEVVEGSEKFPVTLTAIKQDELNTLVSLFEAKGVQLSGIDVNCGDAQQPQAMGVNLLPKEVRKKKDWTQIKWNAGLSAVAIALLWFVMFSSLENKQAKIESLEAQVTELRKDARRAKLIENQLNESIQAANFLGNLKKNTPSRLLMFSELTQKVPMNTFLTRVMIDNERLEVVGESVNANALIPILNQSALWYEPAIIGNVTQNPRTGKEKFTIRSDFKPADAEEAGNES